jgi:hypothetical protein
MPVITATFSWNFFYPNLRHVAARQYPCYYGHLAVIMDMSPQFTETSFVYNTELQSSLIFVHKKVL